LYYIILKVKKCSRESSVKVILKEDSAELKKKVIGYTLQLLKDATGAADQIGSKDFDNVSSPSPAQLLRGKAVGCLLHNLVGEPGAGAAIRARGNSSICSETDH
jgi:iron complex outermembrane receptor protein